MEGVITLSKFVFFFAGHAEQVDRERLLAPSRTDTSSALACDQLGMVGQGASRVRQPVTHTVGVRLGSYGVSSVDFDAGHV